MGEIVSLDGQDEIVDFIEHQDPLGSARAINVLKSLVETGHDIFAVDFTLDGYGRPDGWAFVQHKPVEAVTFGDENVDILPPYSLVK